MVAGLPLLFVALLGFAHLVIEFTPYSIRQHHVSIRPIKSRVADLLLMIRLVLQRD